MCIRGSLLVKEEHLEGANGLVNGVQALSNVAAPLIGGMFYGIFGVRALVFILSLIHILLVLMLVSRASFSALSCSSSASICSI